MMRIFTTIILIAFSFFAKAQTFSWTGYQHIADESTITIPITVSGLQPAINIGFGVSHICLDITHSYDADIVVKLKSPAGTVVDLIDGVGGSSNNFTGTCLGMDGVPFTIASAPYTGLFFPAGEINSFNDGQNPNGTWLLTVTDISIPDTGSIHSVNIQFTNNPPVQPGVPGLGAPVGTYLCGTCTCPGGASGCDLLPDMTASGRELQFGVEEEPGVLYVSNATPNIGSGPLDIYGIDSCFCGGVHVPCNTTCTDGNQLQHVVKQRIYQKVAGRDTLSYYDRFAGKMTFHPAHGHIHVDNWANYTLRSATSDPDPRNWPIISTSIKQSFCLVNLGNCATTPGECAADDGSTILTVPNSNLGWHTGCQLNQGIYPGNFDVYSAGLNDPMPLTNVCNGTYYLVSITDPDNAFLESNENNNWIAVPITLTQQNIVPTITPMGPTTFCQGGSVILTASPASNYLWSNGEITQSITVTTAGTFTVSSNCGAATLTSPPVTTTIIPENPVAGVSINITSGNNPTCSGAYLVFTATPVNGGNIPAYQWKVNGINVGTNSSVFSTSSLSAGAVVTCTLQSNISCIVNPSVTSNSIVVNFVPPFDQGTSIAQSPVSSTVCAGTLVTYTASGYGLNPTFQWKVDGVNVGTNSNTYSSYNFINNQTVRCDVTYNSLCPVENALGTSTQINDFRVDAGACYPTYWGNGRQQYIILASEMTALGYTTGRINGIAFRVAGGIGDPVTLHGYTIKIAQSTATFATGTFLTPAFSTVFGPVDYTPVLNSLNRHVFSSGFDWDGTSSIIVDICYSNQVVGNAAYQNYQTTTPFVSTTYYENDGPAGANACAENGGNTDMVRPNMIFTLSKKTLSPSNTITIHITPPVHIYKFTGSGSWSVATNWENGIIPPVILTSCNQIIIDPPLGQECILDVDQHIQSGAKLTVNPNKKFKILLSLTQEQ